MSVAPAIPLAGSERLAVALISALEGPAGFGARLQQFGTHFRLLPPRLGRSQALDAAVKCFMCSYSAITVRQPRSQQLELAQYGTAISTLRQELASCEPNGLFSTPSETLCASLLLAQYEVFQPTGAHSYVQLAGGVSAIFKACGPSRVISSEFELAIFNTQYPTIITQCMLNGQPCFLSEPDWEYAMRRSCGNVDPTPMQGEMWIALSKIPGVLANVKALGEPSFLSSATPLYAQLLSQTYKIRASIVAHSDTVTRNLSTPGVFAACPAVYRGPHPVPTFDPKTKLHSLQPNRFIKQATLYHACVIYINTVLQNLLPTQNPALSLQTSQSAAYIWSTLDFALAIRPLGAFYMSFAGPLCYGVLTDPEDKEVLLQGMQNIFGDKWAFGYTHLALQELFHAFVKGGWREEVKKAMG